jgi:hypothetical protein
MLFMLSSLRKQSATFRPLLTTRVVFRESASGRVRRTGKRQTPPPVIERADAGHRRVQARPPSQTRASSKGYPLPSLYLHNLRQSFGISRGKVENKREESGTIRRREAPHWSATGARVELIGICFCGTGPALASARAGRGPTVEAEHPTHRGRVSRAKMADGNGVPGGRRSHRRLRTQSRPRARRHELRRITPRWIPVERIRDRLGYRLAELSHLSS